MEWSILLYFAPSRLFPRSFAARRQTHLYLCRETRNAIKGCGPSDPKQQQEAKFGRPLDLSEENDNSARGDRPLVRLVIRDSGGIDWDIRSSTRFDYATFTEDRVSSSTPPERLFAGRRRRSNANQRALATLPWLSDCVQARRRARNVSKNVKGDRISSVQSALSSSVR